MSLPWNMTTQILMEQLQQLRRSQEATNTPVRRRDDIALSSMPCALPSRSHARLRFFQANMCVRVPRAAGMFMHRHVGRLVYMECVYDDTPAITPVV